MSLCNSPMVSGGERSPWKQVRFIQKMSHVSQMPGRWLRYKWQPGPCPLFAQLFPKTFPSNLTFILPAETCAHSQGPFSFPIGNRPGFSVKGKGSRLQLAAQSLSIERDPYIGIR